MSDFQSQTKKINKIMSRAIRKGIKYNNKTIL